MLGKRAEIRLVRFYQLSLPVVLCQAYKTNDHKVFLFSLILRWKILVGIVGVEKEYLQLLFLWFFRLVTSLSKKSFEICWKSAFFPSHFSAVFLFTAVKLKKTNILEGKFLLFIFRILRLTLTEIYCILISSTRARRIKAMKFNESLCTVTIIDKIDRQCLHYHCCLYLSFHSIDSFPRLSLLWNFYWI